jgi:uncharacterized protein
MAPPIVETDTTEERRALFFEHDGGWCLLGSRCAQCSAEAFPVQSACARCGATDMHEVALPRTGTVWTFTVQRNAPKPPFRGPREWAPFALGYVDLGTVKVETQLSGRSVEDWKIGDSVQLRIAADADNNGLMRFSFHPAQEQS